MRNGQNLERLFLQKSHICLIDRQSSFFEMEQRTLFEGTRFDRSKQKGTKQKVFNKSFNTIARDPNI